MVRACIKGRPALIIFGGGYTLYALDAADGAVYWKHDYPGRPGPPSPNADSTRIFSSPVVVDDRVIFGVDEDGQGGSAGYVAAANLATGDPVWGVAKPMSMPLDACSTTAVGASGLPVPSCPTWGWWYLAQPTATLPAWQHTADSIIALTNRNRNTCLEAPSPPRCACVRL